MNLLTFLVFIKKDVIKIMIYLVIFIFGTCYHSFLLCFAKDWSLQHISLYRRSQCDKCRHPLSWLDVIPIMGFLLNKGHCKYCEINISIKYPLFEIIGGILFTSLFFSSQSYEVLFIFLLLQMMALIDYFAHWVPDLLQVALALLVIGYQPTIHQWWFAAMIFIILLILSRLITQGIGGADIKCLTLLALYLPIEGFPFLLLIASISAILYHLFKIIFLKRESYNVAIPFIPFICFSFYLIHMLPL